MCGCGCVGVPVCRCACVPVCHCACVPVSSAEGSLQPAWTLHSLTLASPPHAGGSSHEVDHFFLLFLASQFTACQTFRVHLEVTALHRDHPLCPQSVEQSTPSWFRKRLVHQQPPPPLMHRRRLGPLGTAALPQGGRWCWSVSFSACSLWLCGPREKLCSVVDWPTCVCVSVCFLVREQRFAVNVH